jgi:hypothetical protein
LAIAIAFIAFRIPATYQSSLLALPMQMSNPVAGGQAMYLLPIKLMSLFSTYPLIKMNLSLTDSFTTVALLIG